MLQRMLELSGAFFCGVAPFKAYYSQIAVGNGDSMLFSSQPQKWSTCVFSSHEIGALLGVQRARVSMCVSVLSVLLCICVCVCVCAHVHQLVRPSVNLGPCGGQGFRTFLCAVKFVDTGAGRFSSLAVL